MTSKTRLSFTRAELYALVWTEPTRRVAATLGISDVGLAKICRKYHIPRPWRGYWREKETGKRVRQPGLLKWPNHLGTEPEAITFRVAPTPADLAARPTEPQSCRQQRVLEGEDSYRITVASTLTEPNKAIRRARTVLKHPGQRGILWPKERPCLDVNVTQPALDRALRVCDAIIKGLSSRGWPFELEAEHPFRTFVTVLGERVALRISEQTRRVERSKPSKSAVSEFSYKEYDYFPTDVLTLELSNGSWATRRWSDGKKRRLEDCLHEVMIGFVEVAERIKEGRREQERRRLEWLAEERLRVAALERQEREKDRRAELQRQIEQWTRAREVRAYVDALKEAARDQLAEEPDGRLARWVGWADAFASRIDPFRMLERLPQDPEGYGRKPIEFPSPLESDRTPLA